MIENGRTSLSGAIVVALGTLAAIVVLIALLAALGQDFYGHENSGGPFIPGDQQAYGAADRFPAYEIYWISGIETGYLVILRDSVAVNQDVTLPNAGPTSIRITTYYKGHVPFPIRHMRKYGYREVIQLKMPGGEIVWAMSGNERLSLDQFRKFVLRALHAIPRGHQD